MVQALFSAICIKSFNTATGRGGSFYHYAHFRAHPYLQTHFSILLLSYPAAHSFSSFSLAHPKFNPAVGLAAITPITYFKSDHFSSSLLQDEHAPPPHLRELFDACFSPGSPFSQHSHSDLSKNRSGLLVPVYSPALAAHHP